MRFGYDLADDGSRLLPNATEQAAIAAMCELRAAGESYRDIAAELTRRGIFTKEGNDQWTHTAVQRILKRAA
ncbi:MAG TPA: recombinase family protein [Pirellulales bacterium]|nr:recombinase family protein [Pirellulales bacterium]